VLLSPQGRWMGSSLFKCRVAPWRQMLRENPSGTQYQTSEYFKNSEVF